MWDLVGNPEDRFSHNKTHCINEQLYDKTGIWLCFQGRHGSAWAFIQSYQSLHCSFEEGKWPLLPFMGKTIKTEQMSRLIRVFS